jgi:SAM-dependent methyltransferase
VDDDARFWQSVLGSEALPWGQRASPAVALLAARLSPGAAVLVPGCGYGRNAVALGRLGYRVTACDFAPAGIARAQRAFAHPHVHYVVADAFAPPPGPYAAVFCHFLLHLFRAAPRQLLVAALSEALVPGGLLLATGLSTRAPFYRNGEEIEPDTWSNPGWVPVHFYTAETLAAELAPLRILEASETDEPEDKPSGPTLTPAVYVLAQKLPRGATTDRPPG